MMNESEIGFSQLVDCTEDEFREFCGDKDLGYLQSFHNLMTQTFNEVRSVKDALVDKLKDKPEEERSEEETTTLQGLYSKMLRIEQRVFILRELIKSRSVPAPEVPCSGT